jgi:hypothetical protein
LELRDAVQEGDDDESDDGECGGGDHGVLLSHDCFRNSRAKATGVSSLPICDGTAGAWKDGGCCPSRLLRKWSVRFPTQFTLWIGAKPAGSRVDPAWEPPCHESHRPDGFVDTPPGRWPAGGEDYCGDGLKFSRLGSSQGGVVVKNNVRILVTLAVAVGLFVLVKLYFPLHG